MGAGGGDQQRAVIDALRSVGLRVTGPRVAVLDAVAQAPHGTASSIAQRARATAGSVSTQAVYDVLDALTAAGLLRRIQPAGSPARYETRTGDNHHHLICRVCGATTDVDCASGSAPCLTPDTTTGFTVDEAEIVFWGHCASCCPTPELPKDAS